jgi:hypothetical protein
MACAQNMCGYARIYRAQAAHVRTHFSASNNALRRMHAGRAITHAQGCCAAALAYQHLPPSAPCLTWPLPIPHDVHYGMSSAMLDRLRRNGFTPCPHKRLHRALGLGARKYSGNAALRML